MFFSNRIPEPKIMEKEEMKVFEELSNQNYKRWILPFVDEAMQTLNVESGKVLDIGCGPGLLVKELAKRSKNLRVIGVDVSPEAIKLAKKNCRSLKNVKFLRGDVTSLPFPNGTFDLIVCKDSFHEFPNLRKALQEVMRVLKPGGILYAQDLRRDLPMYLLRRAIPPDTTVKKLQFYSARAAYIKTEIRDILKQLDIQHFFIKTRKLTENIRKNYGKQGISLIQLKEGFQARYILVVKNK
ncbi:MAG: type 11 methyltransferase [Parcubacteria group bacterium Gr01-1014_30]|nr:MAG: type 11 methyltransferase [Parcubacteria group bacterium Gr01-1014_30]